MPEAVAICLSVAASSEACGIVQATLQPILSATARVLNSGDEVAAQEVLEVLIEVAEVHPRFFRRQLGEVVAAMLQVCGLPDLTAAFRCVRFIGACLNIALQWRLRIRPRYMQQHVSVALPRAFETALQRKGSISALTEMNAHFAKLSSCVWCASNSCISQALKCAVV